MISKPMLGCAKLVAAKVRDFCARAAAGEFNLRRTRELVLSFERGIVFDARQRAVEAPKRTNCRLLLAHCLRWPDCSRQQSIDRQNEDDNNKRQAASKLPALHVNGGLSSLYDSGGASNNKWK